MLSFFDMTHATEDSANVSGFENPDKLPRLRLIAYNPKHSYKLKSTIAGPDLVKIISSRGVVDEQLLLPNRRTELAKIIAKCVRLQRRRNALPEYANHTIGTSAGGRRSKKTRSRRGRI